MKDKRQNTKFGGITVVCTITVSGEWKSKSINAFILKYQVSVKIYRKIIRTQFLHGF